ncbi:MAG: EAL domain-containing protein [Oscillospiraceae bacterium]
MMHYERGKSIFRRMMALLMAILLVQMCVYLLVFIKGGVVGQTEKNAFSILSERTANRQLYLKNEMLQRWSNTRECESEILEETAAILQRENLTAAQLKSDPQLCQELIATAAPKVTEMLRRNGVNGAFLVLDCPNEEQNYPGFYVRDYDPTSYSEDNGDLLLERGLPITARNNGIAMDSYWNPFVHLENATMPDNQFYFAPLNAVKKESMANRNSAYYYRWSEPFRLSAMDREVVAYSLPLIGEDGTVLGVLGIDLTVDYLSSLLRYEELNADKAGAYYLGITHDGGKSYTTVASNGPSFRAFFGVPETLNTVPDAQKNIVQLQGAENGKGRRFYAAVRPITLYNSNTSFAEDQWALLGILDSTHLLQFPRYVEILIFFSAAVSLALGVGLVLLAARSLTAPITNLVEHLHRSDPNKPIRLHRIHINEIDTLTEAIENLSNAAAESASRISKIIGMAHIPLGVFEYQRETGQVFCSRSFHGVLGWELPPTSEEDDEDTGDSYMPIEVFQEKLRNTLQVQDESGEPIFYMPHATGGGRWVQLFYREEAQSVLGAFLDVTHDMEAKRKIEYERDYDVLTDLYNRRAFDMRVESLFSETHKSELGVAALMMFDLDNLKYVNDTYGHDYGDRYIQAFAKSLNFFSQHRALVGRRSGDEFNVLLYGYEDKENLRLCTDAFWAATEKNTIILPGGDTIRVRASGGLAWYPEDANTYDELMRLADFAMYNIKHTVKGALQEFDRSTYEEKSILIHGQDALNRLIDGKLVRYALQPIVSAKDGSVYGYEMLMRPSVAQLEDLSQLFQLAKAQSKLQQIEILTWYESLRTFEGLMESGKIAPGAHVFINSIGNQSLPLRDLSHLEATFPELLSNIVIEITEGEDAGCNATKFKQDIANRWGAQIAIDDFGTGFNSEGILIDTQPDLVKIDISLVRDIDTNKDKLTLVQNLLHYAKTRGIKVLGEGVETRAELDTLIACGIDFIQGYYVALPMFEVMPIREEVVSEIQDYNRQCKERAEQDNLPQPTNWREDKSE